MRRASLLVLPFFAVLLMAAAPQRGLSLQVPASPGSTLPRPPVPPAQPPASAYEPAPLPNRDLDFPTAPRATNGTTVAPSLFTRGDQYRGEGFSKGSTAQAAQDRGARPGAGISLKMPLTGN